MKLKKITALLLCLALAGCGSEASAASTAASTSSADADAALPEVPVNVTYTDYKQAVSGAVEKDNYTAGVQLSYDMHYSDDTMDAFDMDEVLVYDKDTSQAHLTQNIDSNGTRTSLDGYWYGGRLYNSYNGVTYYEDMDFDTLTESMLVPLDATVYDQDDIEKLSGSQKGTDITYTVTLDNEAAADLFSERYDTYGLKDYDDYAVTSAVVADTFDTEGHLIKETADFEVGVSYEGENVTVDYSSEVSFSAIGTSSVEISDELKSEQQSYVSYQDIDTSSIETLTDDDDSAESTVEATFRKRLVNRLGYEEDGDVYTLTFNSDNESYEIDFSNHTFMYSERTIVYSYNWVSDVGSMGSCTVDFSNDNHRTSECEDSTADMIETVKTYFEMELYYCGLTLEDLQSES